MQTFLPYPNFWPTAKCLDYRRLGKQRVEANQILNIITGKAKPNKKGGIAWINHPAVKMWWGYENCLVLYRNVIISEWVSRGYNNNMPLLDVKLPITYPKWFGNKLFHASHRANLLRKDFEYYSQFGWNEDPEMEYFWPI